MIASKGSSIETLFDLEDFLHGKIRKPTKISIIGNDLINAKRYYQILNKMRENATSIVGFSYLPAVEVSRRITGIDGNMHREIVTFNQIRDFCKYISEAYLA